LDSGRNKDNPQTLCWLPQSPLPQNPAHSSTPDTPKFPNSRISASPDAGTQAFSKQALPKQAMGARKAPIAFLSFLQADATRAERAGEASHANKKVAQR